MKNNNNNNKNNNNNNYNVNNNNNNVNTVFSVLSAPSVISATPLFLDQKKKLR